MGGSKTNTNKAAAPFQIFSDENAGGKMDVGNVGLKSSNTAAAAPFQIFSDVNSSKDVLGGKQLAFRGGLGVRSHQENGAPFQIYDEEIKSANEIESEHLLVHLLEVK